ncbi:hypothetical protein [Pontibacter silvestris]|uniref:hypothetical protein n=1 Tax=Pontibacter silvestris TaxID=2305183 RepID=UPI001E529B80|nr:hypothetical protein [Pontibacter silvestris]MCC9138462.1 hypothetical protein [Pontibacter silvestris]
MGEHREAGVELAFSDVSSHGLLDDFHVTGNLEMKTKTQNQRFSKHFSHGFVPDHLKRKMSASTAQNAGEHSCCGGQAVEN